jgi:hypothetical protein
VKKLNGCAKELFDEATKNFDIFSCVDARELSKFFSSMLTVSGILHKERQLEKMTKKVTLLAAKAEALLRQLGNIVMDRDDDEDDEKDPLAEGYNDDDDDE